MPAKFFLLSKKANKEITKLPIRIQDKVDQAFEIVRLNPISVAKLEGELSDQYKFRIGDYRIVYKFDPRESLVEVVKVEHRRGVYK